MRSAVLVLAGLALVVAACGSGDDSSSSSSSGAGAGQKQIKVGLVADIGGLGDRSFNALANKGVQDAQGRLGIEGRGPTPKGESRHFPQPSSPPQQKKEPLLRGRLPLAPPEETVPAEIPPPHFP